MSSPIPEVRARARRVRFFALLTRGPLLALVPVLLFSAVLLWLLWDNQQEESRKELQQTTRTLAVAVDQALVGTVGRLQVLARSALLQEGQLPDIHDGFRRELAANPDWLNLTLVEAGGVQLVNATVPLGTPLPNVRRAHHDAVLRTGGPAISDVYTGRLSRESSIAVSVGVPDRVTGGTRAVLTARLDPKALTALLVQHKLRKESVASILDRELRFVARTRNVEEVFGQPAAPEFRRQARARAPGIGRGETIEGDRLLFAWERLPSGWTVAIGMPAGRPDAPLNRSFALLGVLGTLAFAAVVWSAWRQARRLSRDVDLLRADAERLAMGEAVPARHSRVEEFDALFVAQHLASGRLMALLDAERQARQQAEEANRQKDEFLAMLGHELRNPLGAVLNGLRALGHPRIGLEERARVQALAERQAVQLKRLVDDLLDVSRAVTGKIRLERAPLDLGEVTARAVEALRTAGTIAAHDVRLDTRSVPVDGDAVRLGQVVGNLLTNAAKFTPAGGRIDVSVHDDGDTARLVVRDDGRGIDPALLPRVFDLFVQGEQGFHRADGGLGIGLTLVRRLVELHGGRIDAESDGPGRGACFTVRLPRARPATDSVDTGSVATRDVGGGLCAPADGARG